MTAVTIGNKLEKERTTFIVYGPLSGEADSLGGSDDVHAIDLETWDLVTACEVFGVGGTTLCRGAHTVLVVFTDEHCRKIP